TMDRKRRKHQLEEVRNYYRNRIDPFAVPPRPGATLAERVGAFYDEIASSGYYDVAPDGFLNFGYWERETVSSQAASENLMEPIIDGLSHRSGAVLDVACGLGATSRHLCRYWKPEDVVGINVTSTQIDRCRTLAPGCSFLVMDATALTFAAESFDHIV